MKKLLSIVSQTLLKETYCNDIEFFFPIMHPQPSKWQLSRTLFESCDEELGCEGGVTF